jgi:hypothetical protein
MINSHRFAPGEKLTIVTHSHGGNVAFMASHHVNHKISVGRLANGAEIAARVETSGTNTTVGILGAYNEGGAQFAGTLNSLEKGAVAVAQKAGSETVTIQAIATNAKLTKFLLKHGFSKTTVKVGKETVQAVQKTLKVAKDAN